MIDRSTLRREASGITREVFALFDPHFRAYSLDEASLHLTPYLTTHPGEGPAQVAEQIRSMIKERTQLTCSIGKCERHISMNDASLSCAGGNDQR